MFRRLGIFRQTFIFFSCWSSPSALHDSPPSFSRRRPRRSSPDLRSAPHAIARSVSSTLSSSELLFLKHASHLFPPSSRPPLLFLVFSTNRYGNAFSSFPSVEILLITCRPSLFGFDLYTTSFFRPLLCRVARRSASLISVLNWAMERLLVWPVYS